MSHVVVVPQLELRNVRKVITAGAGNCRVRVTVLGGVSLQLMPGEALAITGVLPLARSMLCAVAAGVARVDAGSVRWGPRGLTAVRYAPTGDAPRCVLRRGGVAPGLIILDAALVDRGPEPDVPALVSVLRPWLAAGGSVLLAAPVTPREWPWAILELAAGQLRPLFGGTERAVPAWTAPARMVAEGAATVGFGAGNRVAPGAPDQ